MRDIQPQSEKHAAYLAVQRQRINTLGDQIMGACPNRQPVTLEIGCGHGHYLVAYAGQHPEASCLGIDLVTKRIQKACQKRDKRHLPNLHFLKAEVRECLAAWPEGLKLERIFILFPDPWPKKRHAKNRVIQPELLDALARIATPGTALHFRTDHRANFEWCRETIAGHPDWAIQPEAAWPFENPSFFQDLFTEYQSLTASFSGTEAG